MKREREQKSEIGDNWAIGPECCAYLWPHLLMIVLKFHASLLSALMIRPPAGPATFPLSFPQSHRPGSRYLLSGWAVSELVR